MLRQVFDIIQKSLSFERISVYLLDEKQERLDLVFHNGLNVRGKISLRVGEGTPGRIVENGEHLHIHDLTAFYETFTDFVHIPGEEKLNGSYIGIALKAHNTTIGIIGMDSSAKFGLSVDDMDFMAIISYQLAAGIEKSRLFEKIQQLSQHDGIEDNKQEGKVTISIGVAAIKSGEELAPEKLTKKADDALYISKRNGRNQVSVSQ